MAHSSDIYRANPAYQLVRIADLPELERQSLIRRHTLDIDANLLKPHAGSFLTAKIVCPATSALFSCLREPKEFSSIRIAGSRQPQIREFRKLVIDNVLQIKKGSEFVSGVKASHLMASPGRATTAQNRIVSLSSEAILFGLRLNLLEPLELALQLYNYNRAPTSPALLRAYGEETLYRSFIKLDSHVFQESLQRYGWNIARTGENGRGWMNFYRDGDPGHTTYGRKFKLYVSPQFEALPVMLELMPELLGQSSVRNFKVGASLQDGLRADKLVVYLDSFIQLEAVATQLSAQSRHVEAQGVPFTCSLREDGLISWGVDPRSEDEMGEIEASSWRLVIAKRLALVILEARSHKLSEKDALGFALQRLELEGIDAGSWAPTHLFDNKD